MRYPFMAILLVLACGVVRAAEFRANDYGAKGDDATRNTVAIQKANRLCNETGTNCSQASASRSAIDVSGIRAVILPRRAETLLRASAGRRPNHDALVVVRTRSHQAGTLPDYKELTARFGERFQPQNMQNFEALPSGLLAPMRLIFAR